MTTPSDTTDTAPDTVGDRARRIAALHALADFFAEHPEYPLDRMRVDVHADVPGKKTGAAARHSVAEWANANSAQYTEGSAYAAHIPVLSKEAHSVEATYWLFGYKS